MAVLFAPVKLFKSAPVPKAGVVVGGVGEASNR
jgi:hypothetical protein